MMSLCMSVLQKPGTWTFPGGIILYENLPAFRYLAKFSYGVEFSTISYYLCMCLSKDKMTSGISFTDLSGFLCVPTLGWLFGLRSGANCFSWYCLTSSDTFEALVEGPHFPLCRGKLREVYILIGHDSCHKFLGQRWQPKASWNQWVSLWECFAPSWQICYWCLLWAINSWYLLNQACQQCRGWHSPKAAYTDSAVSLIWVSRCHSPFAQDKLTPTWLLAHAEPVIHLSDNCSEGPSNYGS